MMAKNAFIQFDTNRNGFLEMDEYSKSLLSYGYELSPLTVNSLLHRFDPSKSGKLNLDSFIESLILLAELKSFFDDRKKMNYELYQLNQEKIEDQQKNEDGKELSIDIDDLISAMPDI